MPRERKRAKLQDGFKFDLNAFLRPIPSKKAKGFKVRWTVKFSVHEEATGQIKLEIISDTLGKVTVDISGVFQIIEIRAEPRYLGGQQWYFKCPQTGRRVSVLWKPYGSNIFASRQAWQGQVAYSSQFETRMARAMMMSQSVINKLASSPDGEAGMYKPKGMHWKTYDKLIAKCERYEATARAGLRGVFGQAVG